MFNKIINHIKTSHGHKPWASRFIITLLILGLLLIGVRIALSPGIIYGATSWLKKQGIDATIEAVDINIFDGSVALINASGSKDGKALFNIGSIDIYWRWAPLSDKTIVVTKVGLDKFSVNIEQYSDEIIVGGVHVPSGLSATGAEDDVSADTDDPDEQAKPWAASLGEVIFTNLNICYLQHTTAFENANKDSLFVDYCVDLKKMSWTGTISYATDVELIKTDDVPISSTGDFILSGLSITDNKLNKKLLVSKSNTLDKLIISGLNSLSINRLEMNDLSLLQREDKEHKDSIRFSQLSIDEINLSSLNSLTINNISVSRPGVYLVKQNPTDWEYQEWIPPSATDSKVNEPPEPGKQTSSGSSFKLAINNISINDSDLCYLDSSPSLYYCLTFANLDWQGLVKYDTRSSQAGAINLLVKGDLKLLGQNIHNQTIDRDLLGFESLTLSKVDVSGINNISLESFNIKKLAALQRSENKDDNTASFEELAINDIKYRPDNIDINTIELTGLANTVSKNKNGSWEFDKWRFDDSSDGSSDNGSDGSGNNKTSKTQASESKSQQSSSEKFVISLNKVNVTSDNKILFTDNSTEPAMNMGLQSLALDINNLYTSKPDSSSSFKLYAKTILHSTIDIEGTVKPFADKLSFDANGQLKGFDLRAATPATKKAIGHIIQSGQLDAELKLLAVDGELDSNIGLSLYHFNIKASSKKDAEKLDAKFGMPLNQTLVLLRDKDDSIHLDIPITGDVNNPEFEPMDVIIKATSKAATATLITFYTPYGLAYAGGSVLFNLATAMNFDPVEFKPGTADIKNEYKDKLDNLAKLMGEKPQIHLTLCGIANMADLYALYPALKQQQTQRQKENPDANIEMQITSDQNAALVQLAQERQTNIKEYLIKESAISHDRLILCEPEYQKHEDAIAGVEINI